MTTNAFSNADMKLASGNPAAAAEVMAELHEFAATRPYLTMTLSELTQVYTRLGGIARRWIGALSQEDGVFLHRVEVLVSGEAWKIANPSSPDFRTAESAARRDESVYDTWNQRRLAPYEMAPPLPPPATLTRGTWTRARDLPVIPAALPAIEVPADLIADLEAGLRKAAGPDTGAEDTQADAEEE